jgi:PhnB protein
MKANIYLNFNGQAEEAFHFYRSVFGGEFTAVHRMSEAPEGDKLPDKERNRILHIGLPVGENLILMASDILESAGHTLQEGNNYYVCIQPDSEEQAHQYFNALAEGGEIEMPLEQQFWGSLFGSFTDKFGIKWMVDYYKT